MCPHRAAAQRVASACSHMSHTASILRVNLNTALYVHSKTSHSWLVYCIKVLPACVRRSSTEVMYLMTSLMKATKHFSIFFFYKGEQFRRDRSSSSNAWVIEMEKQNSHKNHHTPKKNNKFTFCFHVSIFFLQTIQDSWQIKQPQRLSCAADKFAAD